MPGPMSSSLPSPNGLSMFAPSPRLKGVAQGLTRKDMQAQGTVAGGTEDLQIGLKRGRKRHCSEHLEQKIRKQGGGIHLSAPTSERVGIEANTCIWQQHSGSTNQEKGQDKPLKSLSPAVIILVDTGPQCTSRHTSHIL